MLTKENAMRQLKNNLKKYISAITIALSLSSMGFAGTMGPQQNEFNWNGFYIGANGGWGWSVLSSNKTPYGPAAVGDIMPFSNKNNLNGSMFGIQFGLNSNYNEFLLGIEGDFDGTSINGADISTTPSLVALLYAASGSTDGFIVHNNINWLTSVRGRIGANLPLNLSLFPTTLVYFTGGAAWEQVYTKLLVDGAIDLYGTVSTPASFSKTHVGYIVGGGIESMLLPNWTIRAEYLFYGFNQSNNTQVPFANCAFPTAVVDSIITSINYSPCGAIVGTGGNNINSFRLGVNYKFS